MTVRTFVDTEYPIRNWLRGQGLPCAARVYLGTPKGPAPSGPWLTLHLVDDYPLPGGQAPMTTAVVQIDCWGKLRADAAHLSLGVVTACENLAGGVALDGTLRCFGASVRRRGWLPDPANDLPRYSIDVAFDVMAVQ